MEKLQICKLLKEDIPSGILESEVLRTVPGVSNGSCALCGRCRALAGEAAYDDVYKQIVLILGLTEVTAVAKLCKACDLISSEER